MSYYDQHAAEVAAKYRLAGQPAWQRQFQEAFPAAGRVLDVGSGSGRDAALLLSLGFDAFGTEPSAGMRSESIQKYPELKNRLFSFGLPLPEDAEFGGQYDGAVCSAVFMHVPEAERIDAAFSLRRLLKQKGKLWLSVPGPRSGLNEEHRDGTGRLFKTVHPEYLTLLFERLEFQLLRRWEEADRLGRADVKWNTFIFELDSSGGKPLDRIEGVLNRDRKTATYKLALFRAFSEVGTLQHHQAEWLADNEVAMLLRLISEKWFLYCWPIFESAEFIPQNNGEQPSCSKPVAFRKLETGVVDAYRNRGGLSQFLMDAASGQMPAGVRKTYEATLRCIGRTIKEGPVVFASGKMFRCERSKIVVDAGAWREFCQLGHWIEPAVVLRWVEETSRMSAGRVPVADALNRLVINPTEERNVGAAREVFDGLVDKRCVWSDRKLTATYAVDHVIPFSLWHYNDLLNLLPCDARVNGSKSDRLPERGLLFRRKEAIVFYWEQVHARHAQRFEHELAEFAGTKALGKNWENTAFVRLSEAVETTAIQRGIERWCP